MHRRALVLALVVGLAVAVGTGGAAGLLLGTLTGAAATVVLRRPAVGAGGVERQEAADLPLALDLLSACCGAGVPLLTAVEAVADAVGGPLGRSWAQGAVAVRLGADPVDAWGGAGAADRAGRLLAAAAASGHGLAEDLRRLAAEEREAARRRGEAAARRAGVLAVLPLGLCFLPAFVLVGVVPVVLGLARGVLG